jgi:hypothetical protein
MTGAQSSMDGISAFQRGSFDLGHITPLSPQAMPAAQKELTVYLRLLATLHTAGILSDEEFSSARGRLLGS